MARYAVLTDCTDPALAVDNGHLAKADAWVDGQLRAHGINPADIVLPQALLTDLAAAYAQQQAAIEQSRDDGVLMTKAREYRQMAAQLASLLTREALGIAAPTGSGFGFFTLGRG